MDKIPNQVSLQPRLNFPSLRAHFSVPGVLLKPQSELEMSFGPSGEIFSGLEGRMDRNSDQVSLGSRVHFPSLSTHFDLQGPCFHTLLNLKHHFNHQFWSLR